MKILKTSVALGLALLFSAGAAQAREPGAPTSVPPGHTMAVAIGATPPPGFYLSSRTGYWDAEAFDVDGNPVGQTNQILDSGLQLLWVPGVKILGGDYKAAITVPYMWNSQSRTDPFPPPLQGDASLSAMGNLGITPISLSWMLEPGIFVSADMSVFAPTGEFSATSAINSGANFWTFVPSVGFSYLRDGWNASLHASYFINTENKETGYKSGDQILINATAMKDVGGWSIGPVAYWSKQVTADVNSGSAYGGMVMEPNEQFGMGLGVTKMFGRVEANLNITKDLMVSNSLGGTKVWFNLTMPLGK